MSAFPFIGIASPVSRWRLLRLCTSLHEEEARLQASVAPSSTASAAGHPVPAQHPSSTWMTDSHTDCSGAGLVGQGTHQTRSCPRPGCTAPGLPHRHEPSVFFFCTGRPARRILASRLPPPGGSRTGPVFPAGVHRQKVTPQSARPLHRCRPLAGLRSRTAVPPAGYR